MLLLLSLLVLAVAPGWAPAGFEHRPQTTIGRRLEATKVFSGDALRGNYIVAEPLPEYGLYLPTDAAARGPLRILVALHGMGGNGPEFAKPLLPIAEKYGWAVLAPTMNYRDFRDPSMVRKDGEHLPRLKALLDALPQRTGLTFQSQVLFYGFSRGSQEAHRFSFMYPELTLGVAGMSAGSYTLPSTSFKQNAQEQTLQYPFGTGDVEQICGRAFNADAAKLVSYWIAVGGRDNRFEDVPRQWDPYVGTTRVERAQRFVAALQHFGAPAQVTVFPGALHEITDQMRDGATRYLATLGAEQRVALFGVS